MNSSVLVESKTAREQFVGKAMVSPRFNGQLPVLTKELEEDLQDIEELRELVIRYTSMMIADKNFKLYRETLKKYHEEVDQSLQIYAQLVDNFALAATKTRLKVPDYLSLFNDEGFSIEKTLGNVIEQHLARLITKQGQITGFKREVGADFLLLGQTSILLELKKGSIQRKDIRQAADYATEGGYKYCVLVGKVISTDILEYAKKRSVPVFVYSVKEIAPIIVELKQLCGDDIPIMKELKIMSVSLQ